MTSAERGGLAIVTIIGRMLLRSVISVILLASPVACGGGVTPGDGAAVRPIRYAVYLHGRIAAGGEGAVHPEYGRYAYDEILAAREAAGFEVVAWRRRADADEDAEGARAAGVIDSLVAGVVPARHITLVGASLGAYIALLAADSLGLGELNVVLLAGCSEGVVEYALREGIVPHGRVLAMRDAADTRWAGPCARLFERSATGHLSRDSVLELGVGHGLVYRPYPQWVNAVRQWGISVAD